MKILVLSNDQADRKVIQQVLERAGHDPLHVETSQAAWDLLERGDSRFVIADRTTTDLEENQLIARIRSAKLPGHVYILLVIAKSPEQDHTGADDYLYKPLGGAELKSRIAIGERILGLGDNLTQAKDQLENRALLDNLTNLLNQKAFLTMARGELERARRTQSPFSLIALNITDFESLQHFHGQETTENVLRLIAQLIREKSRPYDCIGRWDTDQFFIALPGVIGADSEKFVERIVKGIHSTSITTVAGLNVHLELGAGIVAASRISASMEIEELIAQAIQALLRIKDGGNQISLTYV
jgi:diguanylate cyclase (GGDEF)-like protein